MSTNTRIPAVDHTGIMSSAKWAARFAYAAGTTGILANLFLIAMYALLGLQDGSPVGGPCSAQPSMWRARPAICWDHFRPRS